MNIKRMYQLLREFGYLRGVLRRFGDSLVPGRYHLFRTMRSLCHTGEGSMRAARPYFDKNKNAAGKLTSLVDFFNQKGFFSNRNRRASGEYEAIYTANNYDRVREVKLFSFQNKRVLVIPVSAKAREAALSEYRSLSPLYPMPAVRPSDKYENAYEISMVDLRARPEEPAALFAIASCSARAIPESPTVTTVADLCSYRYGAEMDDLLAPLAAVVRAAFAEATAFPLSLQHGDLSRDNLLYGEADGRTDFFWIDWEHLAQRLFFYDYFFYILHTAACGGDHAPLDAYLSGACDEHLSSLFSTFGLAYDGEKRRDYFLLFALAFLKERVCDLGSVDALRMYCDFIDKHLLSEGKEHL